MFGFREFPCSETCQLKENLCFICCKHKILCLDGMAKFNFGQMLTFPDLCVNYKSKDIELVGFKHLSWLRNSRKQYYGI